MRRQDEQATAIDWEGSAGVDPDRAARVTFVAFCLIAGFVALGISILNLPHFAEAPVKLIVGLVGSALAIAAPLVIGRWVPTRLGRRGMGGILFVMIGFLSVTTTTIASAYNLYLVALVLAATISNGPRDGMIFGAGSLFVFSVAYFRHHGFMIGGLGVENVDFFAVYAGLNVLTVFAILGAGMYQRDMRLSLEACQRAQAEAEAASRAKSDFLARMSHEIRTPMNGVLGMADLLVRTELDSQQRLYAGTIHQSGSALLSIINDILDLSKIEAGKLVLDEQPFDLRAIAGDITALLGPSAEKRGIELRVKVDKDVPPALVGDGPRIRQVLTNLIGNGIKFTSEGYVALRVKAQVRGDAAVCQILVEDTGIGIPVEKLEQIFVEFQQAERSTSRDYGGTGLGLPISRHLVEAMGGEIHVASQPERGSRFEVLLTLPLASAEEAASEISPSGTSQASGTGQERLTPAAVLPAGPAAASPKAQDGPESSPSLPIGPLQDADPARVALLVAEDNEVNRLVIRSMLPTERFNITFATNGLEAVECFAAGQFDAVLMDISMPELDGVEATRRIRSLEVGTGWARTPIVALTAHALKGDGDSFIAAGMDDWLTKPIQRERLIGLIASLVAPGKAKIIRAAAS